MHIYIQEVIKRIPEKNRADIALELESTIYDMLPEDYSDDDIHQALSAMGNPAVLASKYNDRPMHLIGPKYYDVYLSLLKLIVPIAVAISIITMAAIKVFNPIEQGAVLNVIITIFSEGISTAISVFIQTFFWLTFIFAIIERVDGIEGDTPLTLKMKPWSPDDLKQITYVPKKKSIPAFELYSGLIWTAVWGTVYFYADHLLGIYENSGDVLKMITPAFNQDVLISFWPYVILIISLEVILTIYKYVTRQWTFRLATFFTVSETVSLIVFTVILLQSDVFSLKFLEELGGLFGSSPTSIENSIVWGAIIIMFIFTVVAIIDAYRKAKIKTGGMERNDIMGNKK